MISGRKADGKSGWNNGMNTSINQNIDHDIVQSNNHLVFMACGTGADLGINGIRC